MLKTTSVRAEHLKNANFSIVLTFAGMVIFASDEQPSKACSPIKVRDWGRVTSVRALQPVKA